MKIVEISGGLGRVVCSIPALEKLSKKDKVYVITGYPEVFLENTNIDRVYKFGREYIWEDVISKGEYINPEPYHNHLYYNQKHHMIQSFDFLINGEEELSRPKIYLSDYDIDFARNYIKTLKNLCGDKKIIIFQPFGASLRMKKVNMIDTLPEALKKDPNNPVYQSMLQLGEQMEYFDDSYRSMPYKMALKIADKLTDCILLNMTFTPINSKNVITPQFNNRQWFALVNECDSILGIDSSLQHIAYSFGKKGVVFFGSTFIENVGYKDFFTNIQKEGYPKEYFSVRFSNNSKENVKALIYSDEEIDEIIKNNLLI